MMLFLLLTSSTSLLLLLLFGPVGIGGGDDVRVVLSPCVDIICISSINRNVYKSNVSKWIGDIQMESDSTISIIEAIYDMPELKACPIQTTFKIIGKKWTILILREMFRGVTQFNRFLERITGLTPKLLINRLKELQKSRIITRKVVSDSPIRIEYHLTDLGKKLEPVLVAAGSFSMSSMPNEVFKDGKARKPEEIIQMKLVT